MIKSGRDVIEALGGPYAVAAIFAEDVRVIMNWLHRGCPPATHHVLGAMLEARRFQYDPVLAFRQRAAATPAQMKKWNPYRLNRSKRRAHADAR